MSFISRAFCAMLLVSLFSGLSFAQEILFSGYITDAKNEPMPGANVFVKGTFFGASANLDGYFSIDDLEAGTYEIRISAIGYTTKVVEITLPANTPFRFSLDETTIFGEAAIITATRTERDQESVPTPVAIIPKDEIELNGNTRLDDILAEQPGINVISNFGSGVQLQGLDPDYTLILIDGEPLIGRSAGTLDISRINVGNVKQIEVVKGPSSAVWGSDALAGVINIITEETSKPLDLSFDARIGNFNARQFATKIGLKQQGFSSNNFVNFEGTEGLTQQNSETGGITPSLLSYSARSKNSFEVNDQLSLNANLRYYFEDVESGLVVADAPGGTDNIRTNNKIEDFGINPGIDYSFNFPLRVIADYYLSTYNASSDFSDFDSVDPDDFQESSFYQTFQKVEVKNLYTWNAKNLSTVGFGQNIESLDADIYAEGSDFTNSFVFVQHEWLASEKISMTTGFRFDDHSEYSSRLTPKLAFLYKPDPRIHIRNSVGTGFRAPDFRQLFLDFDNPVAGYSVFGARNAVSSLQRLDDLGLIREFIVPESSLQNISAETSLAINSGIDVYPDENSSLRVNFFRNDVRNLIEFQPIAIRTTNQFVFSYFNLDEIRSQGFEVEGRYTFPRIIADRIDVNLNAGYQFLDATREVETERNTIVDGELVTITETNRVELQNRSRDSGNIKLFLNDQETDIRFSLRAAFRGSFNIGDINGNNRIEDFETSDGFWIWDTSISKEFNNAYTLQLGIDNLLDYTDPQFLPGQLGARYYARFTINL